MTTGDNILKAIVNVVFWITLVVKKFYTVFHIIGLSGILFLFSVAGGWVFRMVEAPIENKTIQNIIRTRRGTIDQFRIKIRNREPQRDVDLYVQEYEFVYIAAIIEGTIIENGEYEPLWTLTGAIYYCVTTYTLVGFGNLAPRSSLGRLIAIFYSGISIPVGTLVLGELGDLIVKGLKFLYSMLLRLLRCRKTNKDTDKKETGSKQAGGRSATPNASSNNNGKYESNKGNEKQDILLWNCTAVDDFCVKSDPPIIKVNTKNVQSKMLCRCQRIQEPWTDQRKKSDRRDAIFMCLSFYKANNKSFRVRKKTLDSGETFCRTNSVRLYNGLKSTLIRYENVASNSVTESLDLNWNEVSSICQDCNLIRLYDGCFCKHDLFRSFNKESDLKNELLALTKTSKNMYHSSNTSRDEGYISIKKIDQKMTCTRNSSAISHGLLMQRNTLKCTEKVPLQRSSLRKRKTHHTAYDHNIDIDIILSKRGSSATKVHSCNSIRYRARYPAAYITVLFLISPFRWIYIGNIIRQFLHNVMRTLNDSVSFCPQSTLKKTSEMIKLNGFNQEKIRFSKKDVIAVENCKEILFDTFHYCNRFDNEQRILSNIVSNTKFGDISDRKSKNGKNSDVCSFHRHHIDRSNNNGDVRRQNLNTSAARKKRKEQDYTTTEEDPTSFEGDTTYATTGATGTTTSKDTKTTTSKDKKGESAEDGDDDDDDDEEEDAAPVMATIFITCVYIISGAVALAKFSDNLDVLDAIWFLYISMVTIGYGDVVPYDQKVFIVMLPYIFIGLSLMSSVLNEVTSYFTNNINKARTIGQEVQQIIVTTKNVNDAIAQRSRARARWDFVRRTVWKRNLPEKLVEEARMHKINVFAKERDLIRKAYSIYFYRPPCPEPEDFSEKYRGLMESLQEEGAKGAAKHLLLKHTDTTFDEVLEKYLTLWQRIRRWLKRAFYHARNFFTGASIPPPTPPPVHTFTISSRQRHSYTETEVPADSNVDTEEQV